MNESDVLEMKENEKEKKGMSETIYEKMKKTKKGISFPSLVCPFPLSVAPKALFHLQWSDYLRRNQLLIRKVTNKIFSLTCSEN
jgi:hypothetical protein